MVCLPDCVIQAGVHLFRPLQSVVLWYATDPSLLQMYTRAAGGFSFAAGRADVPRNIPESESSSMSIKRIMISSYNKTPSDETRRFVVTIIFPYNSLFSDAIQECICNAHSF